MSRSPARPTATASTASASGLAVALSSISGTPTGFPVTASQTRTVQSSEPETMMSRSPACPIANARTDPSCPAIGWPVGLPVTASQMRTDPS